MKIALLTANIGGIDEIFPPVKQSMEYELFYYTENTLPFPLPHLNSRMKGKYFKTQAHRFLDHDLFIWVDGSIEVIDPDFIQFCVDELRDSDVLISKHVQRTSPYEELEYIIDQMKLGNKYLLKRYAKEPFYQEYDYYKMKGMPKTVPLYNCFFYARHNDDETNEMFDDWWNHILMFSNFDQTAFSFTSWKHKTKLKIVETDNLFIRNKHQ